MTVSQTPSRGGDPAGEATYALDMRAWKLFAAEFICQIGNTPEEREKINMIPILCPENCESVS